MNKLKRILVVLLSCFMFLATMTASVSAEGEEGAEQVPVTETEPEFAEETTDEQAEEVVIEEEIPAEEETIIAEEVTEETVEASKIDEPEYVVEAESAAVETENLLSAKGSTYLNALRVGGDGELNALASSKTLTYNNDGTYTLSLSVTGDSKSTSSTETTSANVMIIYDVSNSMTANRAQNDTGSMGAVEGSGQGAAEANYYQLYKSQNTNDPLGEGEEYTGTLYYRTSNRWYTYTGKRYSTARRADAAEKALYDMVTDIADGDIEFSLITFSSSATRQVDWTTDASQITGKLSGTGTYNTAKLSYSQGTGWTNALNQGLTQLGSADDDPTYVIFITDGRPSDTLSNAYTPARRINTYDTATHAYNSDDSNTTLFGIYAYGLQEDCLDDVIYYAIKGSQRTADEETDTTDVENNYFKAGSTQALQDAIETIKQNIKNSLDYGGVSFEDGIASDTTNTTLNTEVGGALSGLTYTVTAGDETKYTVTVDGSDVSFKIGDETYSGEKGTNTIDGTAYEYYYAVDSNGDPLTFTVGSGETAREYRYSMGLASMNGDDLTWELTGIGGLVGGYTYTLSFTVWPVQEAYDIAADLNNGLDTYTWNTGLDTYEDLTSTRGYEKGGIAGYPNIVKYPNGTYAVLTNTSQEVTYYIVNTEEIDGVATPT